MKVSELMTKDVVTVVENAMLGEAARLMWEHDIGFIPVVTEKGALAGVITDRDGFIGAYFQGKTLWDIPVKSVMTSRIATIPPEADVGVAEAVMCDRQVHRLPVVEESGKLVGVVSLNDFARRATGEANEEFEEEVAVTLGTICQPRENEIRG